MLEVAGVLKVAKDELHANYKSGTFPKCNYKFPVKCQKKSWFLYSYLLLVHKWKSFIPSIPLTYQPTHQYYFHINEICQFSLYQIPITYVQFYSRISRGNATSKGQGRAGRQRHMVQIGKWRSLGSWASSLSIYLSNEKEILHALKI